MSRNLDYPAELACPHDGWYNGNPKLMIANGTYADYRHRLVTWVEKGKMTESDLATFDAQWKALSLPDKQARRGAVIEATKPTPVRQRDGKVEYVSKPSDNGRSSLEDRKPQLKRQLSHRQALGSIASRPDPLAAEEAALQASRGATMPDKAPQLGHAIPDSMPGMVVTPAFDPRQSRGGTKPATQDAPATPALAGAVA